MVDNPFEPKPAGTSVGGTPMQHKETSKPIAGPIADENNPDTNHPGVMTNIPTADGGKQRDSSGPSAGRSDPPEDPKRANVSAANQGERKFPPPLDMNAIRAAQNQPQSSQQVIDRDKQVNEPQDNYNPNPVTAGSAEDVKMSSGEYSGDVKPGMFIKVSPLNAADDDFVVGKVTGLDVSGLGQMVYIDETNDLKLASFHADDAEILYEIPEEKQGKKIFINDDKTYDARELRMERPPNEKQYVEKQEVLRDQTAKSQFNKNLTTR